MDTISNLLFATIRVSVPLILAGMAGVLSQQVNLLNIAIEGLMLFGAFAAVVVGAQLGSAWLGLLAAILVAVLISLLFSFFIINLKANLIVAGLAVNTLALGLTAYLVVVLFNTRGAYSPLNMEKLPVVHIPLLEQVPFLGAILSGHSILVYVSWIVVFLTSLLLYKTRFGIHLRVVGEHTEAAETAGINVRRVQYLTLLLAGGLAGMAGAQLSIGDLSLYTDNMTNGRGFIALAAVFFGAARPGLTMIGCFIFGLFEALQYRLQTLSGFPTQIVQMLPYLIVVGILTFISVRAQRQRKV